MENWEDTNLDKEEYEHARLEAEILARARSRDADDRFVCASDGYFLDELSHDPCWLVRHAAKRELKREELIERGVMDIRSGDEFPYLDISDVVYELYKEHWIDKHTRLQGRMNSIRMWGKEQGAYLRRDEVLELRSYQEHIQEEVSEGRYYMPYDEFCGYKQPGNSGLYHNRALVEALLDGDKVLLSAYYADINDGYELASERSVDVLVQKAVERSERYGNKRGLEQTGLMYD